MKKNKKNLGIIYLFGLFKKEFFIVPISFFLLIMFFFIGCGSGTQNSNPYGLDKEEHQALYDFFNEFLFQEGGIYSLFSDKPISFYPISNFPNENNDPVEIKKSWLNGWKKKSEIIKTPLFLLFERPSPFSKIARAAFLVNIIATATLLKNRYSEFRNFVGFDFDPLLIVFDIEDWESPFWNKILTDDYFLGLILGYGDMNAWLHKCCLVDYKNGRFKGKNEEKIKSFLGIINNRMPSSGNFEEKKEDFLFSLPGFSCLSIDQGLTLVQKYKEDRERIRKIYKRKDLVTVTLDRLTSKDLPKEPNEKYIKMLTKFFNVQVMPRIEDPDLPQDPSVN